MAFDRRGGSCAAARFIRKPPAASRFPPLFSQVGIKRPDSLRLQLGHDGLEFSRGVDRRRGSGAAGLGWPARHRSVVRFSEPALFGGEIDVPVPWRVVTLAKRLPANAVLTLPANFSTVASAGFLLPRAGEHVGGELFLCSAGDGGTARDGREAGFEFGDGSAGRGGPVVWWLSGGPRGVPRPWRTLLWLTTSRRAVWLCIRPHPGLGRVAPTEGEDVRQKIVFIRAVVLLGLKLALKPGGVHWNSAAGGARPCARLSGPANDGARRWTPCLNPKP